MSRWAAPLRTCRAGSCQVPAPPQDQHPRPATDEDILAELYVRMWSLASGRRLRPGVRPAQVTAAELIDFWADDLTAAAPGRHAAHDTALAWEAR